ncbi:MAG: PKD domain-containing protein [Methanoculleus marisnigri]|uniref:PKD domain containing protein n=2 Tax=Methanoculleus TaxID=45989 RepID=A3CTZ2_METMJ|nr:PKD domain containing protein [Methanoculleus marisnigri JR1]MCC7556595.1 PKD domain-containing protein [Methanoculleus marisnigri]
MKKPRVPGTYLIVFIVAVISIAVIATAAPQSGTFTSGEPGMPGLSEPLEIYPNNLSHADISGSRIVYSDYRNGNWDIFLFNHTSGREYQLTNDSYDQMNPTISCDLVAWYDNSTGAWDLVLLKLHGDDAAYQVCTGPDQGRPGCPAGVVCFPTTTTTTTPTPGPGPGNCSCTADFTWSPQSPAVNATVNFTGNATVDGDCSVRTWAWSFGDGATASGQDVTHNYTSEGTYPVRLNVTLDDGTVCNASENVTVSPLADNCSCTADFTWSPQSPAVNETIDFTDQTTVLGDCGIESWAWNFGDGATGEGGTASHAYDAAGTYTVGLNVTLDDGTACNTSSDVTIAPLPEENCSCTASIATDRDQVEPEQPVAFTGSAEVDGDCSVTGWAWDFGDGATGEGETASHAYAAAGTYTVTLVATLDDGNTCQATTDVTVTAPPEPCSCSASITTSGNSFHGEADIQGDCSVTGWSWDFGDGTTGSGQDVTHDYAAEGTYTVTLTVTLDDGNTCQATTQAFVVF